MKGCISNLNLYLWSLIIKNNIYDSHKLMQSMWMDLPYARFKCVNLTHSI